MKLWLQVLFAQGYLWRDRFPRVWDRMIGLQPKKGRALPVAVVSAIGVWATTTGDTPLGMAIIAGAIGLFLYDVAWRARLDNAVGSLQLWLSAAWAGGLLLVLSLFSITIGVVARNGAWLLAPFAIVCFAFTTSWIRSIEGAYLFFRETRPNEEIIDESKAPGFIRRFILSVAEAYWLLPQQILFGAAGPIKVRLP